MKIRINLLGAIDFCVIAFMIYYCFLPAAAITISTWFVLGLVLLYAAYVALTSGSYRIFTLILCYSALIFYIALLSVLLTDSTGSLTPVQRCITKFGQWFKMFFPILLFYRFTKLENYKTKILLLAFAAIIIAFVVWNSFGVLEENPYVARLWSDFDDIKLKNGITYEYVYAIAALTPLVYWCFSIIKNVLAKIILIIVLISLFSLLIAAQYTIAIVLAVVACLLCFYQKHKNPLLLIISTLVIFVLLFFLPAVLMWISTLFESRTISMRFEELSIFLSGGEVSASGDVTSRMNIYKQCFEYFFRSPIWGNAMVPFDPHSTFLGIMCNLGIIGIVPAFFLSFSIHKRVYEIAGNSKIKDSFMPVHVIWILLGFLNPVHAAMPLNMVVWFLVPATAHVFADRINASIKYE